MKKKRLTRKELIEALIVDDADTINSGASEYLHMILFEGFCGYNNQTVKELREEYNERGLNGE